MPQDLPPSGGYEPVQYKVSESIPPVIALRMADSGFFQKQRNLPARGFRPVYYLAAMGVIMTYGLYKVGQSNREQVYIYPFLAIFPPCYVWGPQRNWKARLFLQDRLRKKIQRELTCAAFAHSIGNWRARRCGRGSI